MLTDPTADRRSELKAQRALLLERQRKTDAVIRAVDRALESMEQGEMMTTDEMMEGFDALAPDAPEDVKQHHREHAAEAKERWGEADAYKESMRRARQHSKADGEAIAAESEEQVNRPAGLLDAGAGAEGAEARAAAEAMRKHISRWFYECSYETHRGLADMHEADSVTDYAIFILDPEGGSSAGTPGRRESMGTRRRRCSGSTSRSSPPRGSGA